MKEFVLLELKLNAHGMHENQIVSHTKVEIYPKHIKQHCGSDT